MLSTGLIVLLFLNILIYCQSIELMFNVSESQLENVKALHEIMKDYDIFVPPPNEINLTLSFRYDTLIRVEDRRQILKSRFRLKYKYFDSRLVWPKFNFSETRPDTSLIIPGKVIWKPTVILANAVSYYTITNVAEVYHHGIVDFRQYLVTETTCEMDLRLYPFDKQHCLFVFDSISFDKFDQYEIHDISVEDRDSHSFDIVSSNEWDITDVTFHTDNVKHDLVQTAIVEVEIARKSKYYVRFLLVPGVTLTSISFTTFFLPADGGHTKVAFGLTCLLAITVFNIMFEENIPPSGAGTPVIGIYFTLMSMNVVFNTVSSALVVFVHTRGLIPGIGPPYKFFETLFIHPRNVGLLCRSRKKRIRDRSKSKALINLNSNADGVGAVVTNSEEQNSNDVKSYDKKHRRNIEQRYKHLARRMNILFAILCVFFLIINTIIFFASVSPGLILYGQPEK